ncbi:MAG: amidohydrolase [Coriobacteriia bacterium]|nr:amidohydrolase [Coriobacteriia bacterium]
MLFKDIAILDENFDYAAGMWVGVKDDTIDYIGASAPENAADYGETYDGAGKLLMPAFYNAHAHAPMTLLRGYAENAPLQQWLNEMVWPFEAKMNGEDNYWATALSCAEMMRFGCVSFSDMYYHTPLRAKAVGEAGMKANLCEGLLAFEPKPYKEYPVCQANEEYFSTLHGAFDGRILMEYNIHAEYTSNPVVCADIAQLAKEKGAGIHVHISETKNEHEECKQRHDGMTPVQYFDSLGVLDVPVTAAHCVWVEEDDMDIMAQKGVTCVCNPASNMKLASGFAPIPRMLEKGINVALGTDGMASNNNHDMMQDMYLMALLYKGNQLDPTVITPKQALYAATRGGALAQGRADCGLVKVGFKADLCVLDVTGPAWAPMHNPLCNVVYAGHGSDVVLTLCDGKKIYENGVYFGVDVEKAKAEVTSRLQRICEELKA